MKQIFFIVVAMLVLIPSVCFAQDEQQEAKQSDKNIAPVAFELDEEKLEIEADIPSVDLIISFKEIQERDNSMKASFLNEIVDSAKDEPF